MALTATERVSVRFYLGYSQATVIASSALESAMTALTTEAEAMVRTVLTRIAATDTALSTLTSSSRAGLKRAEDVEFYDANTGISASSSEGGRQVDALAALLGVRVKHNYFTGDSGGVAGRG